MPRMKPRTTLPPAESPRLLRETSGATGSASKASTAALRKLRETAKTLRNQVAQDQDQIAEEAQDVIATAVAQGNLTKLTVHLRHDERPVLQAIDEYATTHGLIGRNQVVRAALAKLLNIDLNRPH
jgi:hypothetical protein